MKKISSLFLSLLCVFTIVGCGGNNSSNNQNTEWSVVKDATCTEEGLKERYVDNELKQEVIPALGHDYGDWNIVLNETCTTDGKEERQCKRCPFKEERGIDAHHVLKDGYFFDIDTHYYKCENCTDKIDLSNHNFEISKENKYAYLIDSLNTFGSFLILDVGYVQTLTCSDCNIKIIDYNLVEKYYSNTHSTHYVEYIDNLGAGINIYDIKYGLYFEFHPSNYIKIEYDSNYNISKVSFENIDSSVNYSMEYLYKYDENNRLIEVKLQQNLFAIYNFTFNFTYDENFLSVVTYTAVNNSSGSANEVCMKFDDKGNLVSQSNYETISSQLKKVKEYVYDNGYLEKITTWSYDSSGNITSEGINEYNNVFDGQGKLINHEGENTSVSCTYSNKKIASIETSNNTNEFFFEYENDKLSKMTYGTMVYNYQWVDNKISAYDSSNILVVEVEYISDYKIVE